MGTQRSAQVGGERPYAFIFMQKRRKHCRIGAFKLIAGITRPDIEFWFIFKQNDLAKFVNIFDSSAGRKFTRIRIVRLKFIWY